MSTEHLHFVTVTHQRDEDGGVTDSTLTFECRGTIESPCHLYPDEAEEFDRIPRDQWTKHNDCWLKEWFEVGFEATPYRSRGETEFDLRYVPEGSGPIDYEYDEGIFWSWIDGPTSGPQVEQLELTVDVTP